jgi:hypothetical protein
MLKCRKHQAEDYVIRNGNISIWVKTSPLLQPLLCVKNEDFLTSVKIVFVSGGAASITCIDQISNIAETKRHLRIWKRIRQRRRNPKQVGQQCQTQESHKFLWESEVSELETVNINALRSQAKTVSHLQERLQEIQDYVVYNEIWFTHASKARILYGNQTSRVAPLRTETFTQSHM